MENNCVISQLLAKYCDLHITLRVDAHDFCNLIKGYNCFISCSIVTFRVFWYNYNKINCMGEMSLKEKQGGREAKSCKPMLSKQ